jgi:tRNA dimethylallyltransferase
MPDVTMAELSNAAQSAFFLAGPTAVGKTDIALAVAEACDGEIVGADAFQVYHGLDLLTAKPGPADLTRAPHHLVGTVPLGDAFNVGRYQEAALTAIAEIRNRGRLPIVTGGTGLYLRALTRGLADLPSASPELRARLASTPLAELLQQLAALDPQAAAAIDGKNPRRVQRALEVCLVTGQPFSSFRQQWEDAPPFHGVLLEQPREQLYERIDARTHSMFAQGVVEEVREALAQGGVGPTAEQVIGWREITALLRGELTQAQCIAAIQQATRRYAKRQLTWFAREPGYRRVSLETGADLAPILECARAVP